MRLMSLGLTPSKTDMLCGEGTVCLHKAESLGFLRHPAAVTKDGKRN